MIENLPVVAYLGPEGTYTHQAAVERFAHTKVSFEPRRTISDTFNVALAPDGQAHIAFVPWENSKNGQVVDTYDALRTRDVGVRARICGEYTIAIEHCLVVRVGTKLEEVRRVMSHEQALGQCKEFLAKELPGVAQVKVTSTAAAAQAIARNTSSSAGTDAAICAQICVDLYPGLETLRIGIQDEPWNNTRFMMVSPRDGPQLPPMLGRQAPRGMIRIAVEDGCVATVVGKLELRIRLIDRRPSLSGKRGQEYFVEVEAEGACEDGEWTMSVNAAADRVEGTVLGVW